MNQLRFGYNTNGFACHRLDDAIRIIADLGYRGVALTLDHHHCHPWETSQRDLAALDRLIKSHGLSVVIETGARFLLDPARKHEPTLVSPAPYSRARRLEFLKKSVELAHFFNAEAVSFWSGAKQSIVSEEQAWQWLRDGCRELTEFAEENGVQLAFEPEPGMFIADMASLDRLKSEVPSPAFALTLDIGHYFITETEPFADGFRRYAPIVRNVHIEDIKGKRHEHLALGEGELPFKDILRTLAQYNYTGLVNVELIRDSHRAPEVAAAAIRHLQSALG